MTPLSPTLPPYQFEGDAWPIYVDKRVERSRGFVPGFHFKRHRFAVSLDHELQFMAVVRFEIMQRISVFHQFAIGRARHIKVVVFDEIFVVRIEGI